MFVVAGGTVVGSSSSCWWHCGGRNVTRCAARTLYHVHMFVLCKAPAAHPRDPHKPSLCMCVCTSTAQVACLHLSCACVCVFVCVECVGCGAASRAFILGFHGVHAATGSRCLVLRSHVCLAQGAATAARAAQLYYKSVVLLPGALVCVCGAPFAVTRRVGGGLSTRRRDTQHQRGHPSPVTCCWCRCAHRRRRLCPLTIID